MLGSLTSTRLLLKFNLFKHAYCNGLLFFHVAFIFSPSRRRLLKDSPASSPEELNLVNIYLLGINMLSLNNNRACSIERGRVRGNLHTRMPST